MKYHKTNYPDGTFYMTITDFTDPVIKHRLNSDEDLLVIEQLKDICDYNNVEVELFIPCLIDAQADRRFSSNQLLSLKIVCSFINSLKFKKVYVFHPHNPELVEGLIDNIYIIDNSVFITDVLSDIESCYYVFKDLVLLSTDAGGYKPLMKLADKIGWEGDVLSASKSRRWDGEKSSITKEITSERFRDRDILIVDDLCVYGGTFIELSNLLKDAGANRLFLAVSHITVQEPNTSLNTVFDRIYTTNSKYTEYKSLSNLTIFNVA